jgi:hypothetical protein
MTAAVAFDGVRSMEEIRELLQERGQRVRAQSVLEFLIALTASVATVVVAQAAPSRGPRADQVVIDLTKPVNTIVPDQALGAALDGMEKGEVNLYLTPFNIEKMRSAGLRRVTYRTRPELGIEVWHWSEEGSWSDGAHQQGYWTSSDNPSTEGPVTWGYSLPRRGDSVDNATNVGYSRLDDGDPASFWKSNPYLDHRYTGLAQSRPQWIVLSFKKPTPINAARILWGTPFARHFLVQYWKGTDLYWEGKDVANRPGHWTTFPHGDQTIAADPGNATLRLADAPIRARFLRMLLLQSSETAPPGSTDIRDRLGYAVREVSFGVLGAAERLEDVVRHGKTQDEQTLTQVSSTDPWHRAIDRDLGTEQPSLDLVFKSGLNGGMPLMVPVGVFYDTPENAAAEVRYIKRRGWPVRQIELGEEPDGQFIAPEDYADLYLETARALHDIDPTLSLGGPSMQGAMTGTWPDPENGRSWPGRFVARLKARGGLDQLGFFSFEHYAFDDVCGPLGGMLRDETGLMDKLMAKTTAAGVPRSIPWIISEYGFSPFAGRAMSELPSALLAADIVGHFLTLGGSTAFMFGYTPDQPANQNFPCAGYGNMMLFQADDDGRSHWSMPVYYAERMMMQDWGAPADQPHQLYATHSQMTDAKGRPMVTAYPLKAADGHWTVMLINRDEGRAHRMRVVFRGRGGEQAFGAGGALSVVQYSSAQYVWLDRGEGSHPVRDVPPTRYEIKGGHAVVLPRMSLTVVRGEGP